MDQKHGMLCSGTRQALPHRAQQSRELLPFCQKHNRGSLLRLPLPSSIVLALSPKQTLPLPLGEEQGELIGKAVMDTKCTCSHISSGSQDSRPPASERVAPSAEPVVEQAQLLLSETPLCFQLCAQSTALQSPAPHRQQRGRAAGQPASQPEPAALTLKSMSQTKVESERNLA